MPKNVILRCERSEPRRMQASAPRPRPSRLGAARRAPQGEEFGRLAFSPAPGRYRAREVGGGRATRQPGQVRKEAALTSAVRVARQPPTFIHSAARMSAATSGDRRGRHRTIPDIAALIRATFPSMTDATTSAGLSRSGAQIPAVDLRRPDRPGRHGAHDLQRLRDRAASRRPGCSPACAASARPRPRASWRARSITNCRTARSPARPSTCRCSACTARRSSRAGISTSSRWTPPRTTASTTCARSTMRCAMRRCRRATRSTSSTKCTCCRAPPSTRCSRRWKSRRRTPSSFSPPPKSAKCR